jgi:UDP-N-acetylmuramoyl-L-alanyl-D-glutamate--2,6-diaminopimelate ligase
MLGLAKKVIPRSFLDALRPSYHYLLAVSGNIRYGFPARKMKIVGVTGTNGKSTTVELVNSVLKEGGFKTGMTSTVAFEIAGERRDNLTNRTTLGRWGLQKLLAEMVEKGCTHAIIEVASEGIAWHRVLGIPFDVVVFTNLSPEHLNFHKTMENYRNTKGKIFKGLKNSLNKGIPKTIIVNTDDKEANYFLSFNADKKITFGLNKGEIWATNIYFGAKTEYELVDNSKKYLVKSELPARFNIYNMLAAYAVGKAFNIKAEKIIKGIQLVKNVKGRMEQIPNKKNKRVIIDYAVTPDAFELLFKELRRTTTGKIISVFGATGDRDKGKRPKLGEVAAKLTDYTILTEEEPYSENSMNIIKEIESGIKKIKNNSYEIVLDRKEAIETAIKKAGANDTVVVTGMGHQKYRNVGGENKVAWDEAKIIKEILDTL